MTSGRSWRSTRARRRTRSSTTCPPDADTATRIRLAEYFAPVIKQQQADYPWLNDPATRASKDAATLEHTMVESLRELYNPAQLDVLVRANQIIYGKTDERPDAADERTDHE